MPTALTQAVLQELQASAPPLAITDAHGSLIWCSASFSTLFAPVAEPGHRINALLGIVGTDRIDDDRIEIQAANATDQLWRLRARGTTAGGQLISAELRTDLHKAQTQVEHLRERLELVQEFSNTGIFERNPVSFEGVWDRHMYRIYGLPERGPGQPAPRYEEVSPNVFFDDFKPGALMASANLPGVHTQRIRIRRPDGTERRLHTQWKVFHDSTGTPKRILGINTDDTEVYDLAASALDSARRLEALADAARIGVWSYSLDQDLPVWNARMYSLFGLDPDGGVLPFGALVERCIHPEDRTQIQEAVRSWWRGGEGELSIEFRVLPVGDGETRALLIRGSIYTTSPDGARRAEGVTIDITDRQRTLRELSNTVERMKLTARVLSLGTWTIKPNQTATKWDEQMFALRGVVSPARMIEPDEIASFVHPEDRQAIMKSQREQISGVQSWKLSYRVVWPDGQIRWIDSHSVALFDERGRPDGRIGVNWDSTEVHLAAVAERERELAVAENRAKSQAMSRISHELRTPLHAVLGFTQLMQGAQEEADREKRVRWLEHVEHAGRHLLAMIDDVLELTAVEAGELKLASEAVPYATLVSAALPLVTGLAKERGIRFKRGPLEGVARADPVRLRQVVLNLLTNAVKYNRPEGEVRLWTEQEGSVVALHVADTGIGIPADRLGQIFEPFNRLGAENSGVQGSGIGLAIVKVLVESMDGQIQVRSESGEGSEFIVRLPGAGPREAAALFARPGAAGQVGSAFRPHPGVRILYIEDDPVNAQLVRAILEQRPELTLVIAESGYRGLEILKSARFDLVLLDMKLPDIDGFGVLRLMRADPRSATIRCVVLSANATPDDLAAARAAGFVDYWTKPINVERFLQNIDELLLHDA